MEIRGFRVVLRAKSFANTTRFYGEALGLPRIGGWERPDGRGALFETGFGVIEVVGRAVEAPGEWDEAFDYHGPQQKMTLAFAVPSAEQAYETIFFRDKNLPGGLRAAAGGGLLFETHDPDGVRILFREASGR
jgi:catechol 2,3-dioxygenase-like lactoylglutathione lyase family enzyme